MTSIIVPKKPTVFDAYLGIDPPRLFLSIL